MKRLFLPSLAVILLCLGGATPALAQAGAQAIPSQAGVTAAPITDEAQRVYQSFGDAVYQVQVIDLASGKKASIGSGFQFSPDGFLATNYHVVAEAIRKPENNRLEFLHEKGARGALRIVIADVVHDLAILKMETPGRFQRPASRRP